MNRRGTPKLPGNAPLPQRGGVWSGRHWFTRFTVVTSVLFGLAMLGSYLAPCGDFIFRGEPCPAMGFAFVAVMIAVVWLAGLITRLVVLLRARMKRRVVGRAEADELPSEPRSHAHEPT